MKRCTLTAQTPTPIISQDSKIRAYRWLRQNIDLILLRTRIHFGCILKVIVYLTDPLAVRILRVSLMLFKGAERGDILQDEDTRRGMQTTMI